jgi:hypothetical protein
LEVEDVVTGWEVLQIIIVIERRLRKVEDLSM